MVVLWLNRKERNLNLKQSCTMIADSLRHRKMQIHVQNKALGYNPFANNMPQNSAPMDPTNSTISNNTTKLLIHLVGQNDKGKTPH